MTVPPSPAGGWPTPPGPGWNRWSGPPQQPPRSRLLLAVLIPLVTAVVAVLALGGVLLFRRSADVEITPPPAATQVPTSAESSSAPATPEPSTPAPSSPEPSSPQPSTPEPSSPEASSPVPTAQPTPPPSAKPTPTPTQPTQPTKPPTKPTKPPTKPEDILVRNPFYAERLTPSDCAQPPRPLPTDRRSDERYLNRLLVCMAAAYDRPVRAAGYRLTTPQLVIYTGTVETPCGEGLKGYPVFYCGSNETIYSSAGSTAVYGRTLRLGGYWIVFHEFGHHVQQRIGVLESAYTRDEDQLQLSRRIELQADCFMGMTSTSVRSARLTGRDRDEMTTWREAVPDKIHGTSASQLYWVRRGFDSDSFARCSTWRGTKHLS